MAQNRKARRKAAALARTKRMRAYGRSGAVSNGALRAALLGTAAAGALLIAQPQSAIAQIVPPATPCDNIAGATVTCTGNLQPGVEIDQRGVADTYDTLNVNTLNQNIAPAAGTDGIRFLSNDAITINSDTGTFSIVTTGVGADGIRASNYDVDADVSVTHSGDINSSSQGIFTRSLDLGGTTGAVTVNSTANIIAGDIGITADSIGANTSGDTTVISKGNIDAGRYGILANNSNNNVRIESTGNLTTDDVGLEARTTNFNGSVGDINVINNGNITSQTTGIRARARSEAVGDAGEVTVDSTGNIVASQRGIFAESYSDDGSADNITVTNVGNITATGLEGILVRSTAFTGGETTGDVSITSTGNIQASSAGITAITRTGAITVLNSGNVTSATQTGIGVLSTDGSVSITHAGGDIVANISGISGSSTGGGVTINSTGNITASTQLGISASDAGGGAVEVTSTGDITSAFSAVSARSSGPGGGGVTVTTDGNLSGRTGIIAEDEGNGAVAVSHSGGEVTGTAISGISARSATGNITVTLSNGTATGAPGVFAAGVRIQDGANNLLSIDGNSTVRNSGGLTEKAILADGGNETVNNSGTVTGNVDLGAGNNAFNNLAGATFNSGPVANIGAGNLLASAGTLAPGGVGTVQTTALTGNLTQTGKGTFAVDIDLGNATPDRVNVTGTANVDGKVEVQAVNPTGSLNQQVTILSAAGGTTNNGLTLAPTSPALQTALLFPNATDVVLDVKVDFSPDIGLNQNQTNVGNNLNAILGSGGGTVGPVLLALLNGVQSVDDYIDGLNQLVPEAYLNTETASLFAAEQFNSNLLSCPKAGEGFTAVSQGECMWVRYDGRWLDRDATRQNIGYEQDSHGISGGGQVAVAPNWFIGIAGAYENGDLDTDNNSSADSDRYMIGGVIKYQSGPVLMALAGSMGTGEYDMARRLNFGGFTATARSSFDVDHVGATFHAAYLADRGPWYAKPFIDVNLIHIDRESAQETGAGAANQNISGSDETYFSVTPALELGTTIDRGDGRAIRPYVRAGVTFYGDTDQSLTASFAGAPAAAGGFTTTSEFDDIFADIEAGLTLFHGEHGSVSARYEGRFSDDTEVHGFFVKGTKTF